MTSSRGYKGVGMEGLIARLYDNNARKYSAGIYREWAERLALLLPKGSIVLEIAPGPGYLSIELSRRRKCRITGLEISRTFVGIARRNAERAGVDVEFRQGNVAAMPFEDDSFDFLFCTSSFKNFSEPVRALQEMHRVLKSGAQAWISDMRRDVSDETIRDFVGTTMGAKGLAGTFMRYTFQRTLRPRAYTGEQFAEMTRRTPFKTVELKNNAMDFEALLTK